MNTILNKLGIKSLNAMQVQVGKELTEGRNDLVVLSPTGSGKTLAYLLPLQEQIERDDIQVQAIVLVPGRELALQSHEVLQNMKCGVRSMACYGGRPTMEEHRKLREVQPQVVFATPGRLLDHLEKGNIDSSSVFMLVIDEFDKCLEMGFATEMQNVIDFMERDCRRVFLSATDIDEMPKFVNVKNMTKLDFTLGHQQLSERVSCYSLHSESKDKLPLLSQLLSEKGSEQSIVFLNYRDAIERTTSYLIECGFSAKSFHGGLEQAEREHSLHQFSNGSVNILVCTNLAARGLDIPSISNIIHYHLPLSEDEYVHRVGRTARWDKSGSSFFLLGPEETIPDYVDMNPEEYELLITDVKPSQPKMVTLYIGKGKKDKLSKGDIVGFLCKIGGLKTPEIGRIDIYDRYAYVAIDRKKLKLVLKNVVGTKIKGLKTVIEEIR